MANNLAQFVLYKYYINNADMKIHRAMSVKTETSLPMTRLDLRRTYAPDAIKFGLLHFGCKVTKNLVLIKTIIVNLMATFNKSIKS